MFYMLNGVSGERKRENIDIYKALLHMHNL